MAPCDLETVEIAQSFNPTPRRMWYFGPWIVERLSSLAQDVAETESFSVIYDGALAASGQLHFYEYSRAAYAVARLVSTVENFRRTGNIAQRINSKSYVDVLIKAPVRGSFPIDIIIPVVQAATQFKDLTGIPIGTFVEYVVHQVARLRPKQEEAVLGLAKIELSRSKQETKRVRELRKMVENQNVIASTALDLLRKAMDSSDQRAVSVAGDRQSMSEIARTIEERLKREEAFEPYREKLEKIPETKMIRLARKVRPQIAEIGLPLRKSATIMKLAQGGERDVFASLNQADVADIAGNEIDENPSEALLRFIVYDRDLGTGKCDIVDLSMHRIAFSLPINLRSRLKKPVIAALDHDAELFRVRYVRNRDKIITSLILVDKVSTEDEEAA